MFVYAIKRWCCCWW